MKLPEQAVILLVEDREDDILLFRRSLRESFIKNPLFVVRDGEQALDYLNGVGRFENRSEYPLPDIMLLDLKMPRMSGFEVLQYARSRPEFKALRIIVLTSSEDICDVNKAYELGANSFLVKPHEFQNYAAVMATMTSFWLHRCAPSPALERPSLNARSNSN